MVCQKLETASDFHRERGRPYRLPLDRGIDLNVKLKLKLARARPWILRFLALALGITACYFAFRSVDPRRLTDAVKATRWQFVILAALINGLLNTLARALRFSALLSSVQPGEKKPPFRDLLGLLVATRALNALLPARAGETLRTVRLHHGFGYPWESIVAVLMIEPLIETISLGIPCAFVAALGQVPETLRPQFQIAGLAALGALVFALAYSLWLETRKKETSPELGVREEQENHSNRENRFRKVHARWMSAIRKLNSPQVWLRALFWSWLSDLSDLWIIGLCLSSVSLHLGVSSWFVVLIAVNMAIVIPATPGAIGMLEAGAVLALSALGVDQTRALAFALLYHAVHLLPILLLGALSATGWSKKPNPS